MDPSRVTVEWSRGEARFVDGRYSREHRWRFDGGVAVAASSSPALVPLPMSVVAAVDPEEALVASVSSCHMLWFLSIACRRGYRVDHYRDRASGVLGRDEAGKLAMREITLHPQSSFLGDAIPDPGELVAMHEQAHQECFIARSLKTAVRCVPAAIDANTVAAP